ncbi:MAG: hypothetical protein K6E90_04440 [Lachnospiraceae bacterium]|nr:hypothetical protein [Lachnospiraceae bacterium]
MDVTAELLPEPFSEKNIDGSPIDKSAEGKTLFRTPPKPDRKVENRVGNPVPRHSSYDTPIVPSYMEQKPASYSEPAAPSYMEQKPSSYSEPVSYSEPAAPSYMEQKPASYSEPAAPSYMEQKPSAYSEPVSYSEPEAPSYREPEPAAYSEPARYSGPDTSQMAPETEPLSYDPERFDPPVDEKPGMIPNPMKMPPVKKKSSMDYDMDDQDYGDYSVPDTGDAVSSDDGYGYGMESGGADGSDDYGYSFNEPESAVPLASGSESPDRSSSEDDYGSDYGSEYGSDTGADDDYGSDYDTGSDYSSDYY